MMRQTKKREYHTGKYSTRDTSQRIFAGPYCGIAMCLLGLGRSRVTGTGTGIRVGLGR
jgi:hypothetical protein